MNHVLSVPSLKTAQCFKIISLTFTNEKISAPELIWPQILCSSPSSPSSPATLIAGVLCHRPTQQHSCDPVRSPRPEHGGLSAPAVTGSRTTTQHQTSPTSCALCSPRNKSIQLKYHTKILFCTPAGYIAGSTEVKVATEVGKHQDKKSVKGVVRPQQDNRAYSKKKQKKNFRSASTASLQRGRVPAADSAWVTRERWLQTTPTDTPERYVYETELQAEHRTYWPAMHR